MGLRPEDVEIISVTKHWLRYKLPKRLIRKDSNPVCIGQKQKWFLLRLTCREEDVNLAVTSHPEFDNWRWVSYWYPVRQVVAFKRELAALKKKLDAGDITAFKFRKGTRDIKKKY